MDKERNATMEGFSVPHWMATFLFLLASFTKIRKVPHSREKKRSKSMDWHQIPAAEKQEGDGEQESKWI